MALSTTQTIKAGSAVILVGETPTNVISSAITTQIDQSSSPSGYTATDTALVVDTGESGTIAPNVVETGAGTISDPPVIDVLCLTRTGEIVFCYSRTDATDTLNVVRGCGKYWTKYKSSLTQYNQAINDDDEIQLLGSFTLPDRSTAQVTAEDVTIEVTYDSLTTMDNQKGNEATYTSAPASANLTVQFPRNTLADTMRTLGYQGLTDGNSPARYFTEPGKLGAGFELPNKLLLVMPNSVFFNPTAAEIGGTDYLDLAECYIFPKAYIDLNQSRTFSNGSQANLEVTFQAGFSESWQKPIHFGATKDFCRIAETI
ncbi:hypothetical protein GF357_05115 [Candidatus Dojkabacteria bacterium]|nr:hypothetical protein [Candidatus Dojkabacteria bacterium]